MGNILAIVALLSMKLMFYAMKRTLFFASLIVAALACQAQYQLPNPGCEQWDGTSATAEPSHWNSFASSDGSYASMASAPPKARRKS